MAGRIDGPKIRALFSKNLKRLRSRKKLSQLALANMAGLAHNFVNDIENGKKWVSPKTMAKLAEVLQVDPYQFFLPDPPFDEARADILSGYLDDVTDSFQKMVREMKARYLPDPEPPKDT
jgi:transcriptional regulator with XRE-family HTH domain